MLKILLGVGSLQFVAMFIMMLRTKGLAMLLGPEQYGLMGALDRLVAVFVQTAAFSLPFAALRYLSPLWHRDRSEFFALFRRMRNVLTGTLLLSALVAFSVAKFRPSWLGSGVASQDIILIAALAGIPVVGMVPFVQNAIAARFEHQRAMLFMVLHSVVLALSAVLGVWLYGLTGLYFAYAGCGLLFVLFIIPRISQAEPASGAAAVVDRTLRLPFAVWRFGLLQLLPTFLAPAVAYAVFHAVIVAQGSRGAGFMQAAVGVSLAVRGVLGAAHQVFLTPLVNRDAPFAERVQHATNFQRTFFFLVGVLIPPLLLIANVAIWVLYSRDFLPGAPLVTLFVISEIVALAVGTYQSLVIAMDHIVAYVSQNIVAQLVMYTIAALAVPKYGAVGAAIAGLGAQVCIALGTLWLLRARYGFRIPARVSALVSFVLAALLLSGHIGQRYAELTLSAIGIRVLVYVLLSLALMLFLDAEDRKNLGRLFHELRATFAKRRAA